MSKKAEEKPSIQDREMLENILEMEKDIWQFHTYRTTDKKT